MTDMLTDEQFDAEMAELYDLGDRMLSRITENPNAEALRDLHEHVVNHGLRTCDD